MSEKKIVVPTGMLESARNAHRQYVVQSGVFLTEAIVQSALHWLAENPIVPTDAQIDRMLAFAYANETGSLAQARYELTEWQRRMFLAPEPELLSDLLYAGDPGCDCKPVNERIIEAYMLGRKAGQ